MILLGAKLVQNNLFEYKPCLDGPEKKIELFHWNSDLFGKDAHLTFDIHIDLPVTYGIRNFVNYAVSIEIFKYMPVENRYPASNPDIAQEMARFLIAESFYIIYKPVSCLDNIIGVQSLLYLQAS